MGIGGEGTHNHFMLLGLCSAPRAGGVGTGDRELSFSFPHETAAGSMSLYTDALKSQAAHTNLLLGGYSSKRGCYINAFIFNEKTSGREGFVLKPGEIQKLVKEGEGVRMTCPSASQPPLLLRLGPKCCAMPVFPDQQQGL